MLRAFRYGEIFLRDVILIPYKVKIAVYASLFANITLSIIQSKFTVPLFL